MSFNVTEVAYVQNKENEEFIFYLRTFLRLIGIELYKKIISDSKQAFLLVRFAVIGDQIKKDQYCVLQISNNQKENMKNFFKLANNQGYITKMELREIKEILDLYLEEKYYKTAFFLNEFFLLPENDKIVKQAKNFAQSLSYIIFDENNNIEWEDGSFIRTKYAYLRVAQDLNHHEINYKDDSGRENCVFNEETLLEACKKIISNKKNLEKIPAMYLLIANVYEDSKWTNKALEYYNKYEKVGFSNSMLMLHGKAMYYSFATTFDCDKLHDFYDKAARLYQNDYFSRIELARYYKDKGKLEKAEKLFKEAERILVKKWLVGCLSPMEFYFLSCVRLELIYQTKKDPSSSYRVMTRTKTSFEKKDKIFLFTEIEPDRERLIKVLINNIPQKELIVEANTIVYFLQKPKNEL